MEDQRNAEGDLSMKGVLVDQDDFEYMPTPMETLDDDHDVVKMYENFKKFDTVLDHSDHLFSERSSPIKQASVCWGIYWIFVIVSFHQFHTHTLLDDWAEKIKKEWKILEEGLPGMSIHVKHVVQTSALYFYFFRFSVNIWEGL